MGERQQGFGRFPPITSGGTARSQTGSQTDTQEEKEEISVAASIANSSAQDKRNTKQGSHYDHPETDNSNQEDFSIHSAEEARRAIIWGEILQRKY